MEQQIYEVVLKLVSLSPIAALCVGALGTLVVVGQVVVPLTPTKKDDAAWEKIKGYPIVGPILNVLTKFAVIQKG